MTSFSLIQPIASASVIAHAVVDTPITSIDKALGLICVSIGHLTRWDVAVATILSGQTIGGLILHQTVTPAARVRTWKDT